MSTTLHDHRPAAAVCRERGWGPGTVIYSDEGEGPTVIEITRLGTKTMLARVISFNGRLPTFGTERAWSLSRRDWREAEGCNRANPPAPIRTVQALERDAIRAAVAACDSLSEAARRLGIGRSTLYKKLAAMRASA